MPVPRRFDRRPPERDLTRINERIRVPEVRLIDEDGQQLGLMKIDDALRYAQERDLDLVEVAPEAKPPVCRVLDYSKYKYEQAQKLKACLLYTSFRPCSRRNCSNPPRRGGPDCRSPS